MRRAAPGAHARTPYPEIHGRAFHRRDRGQVAAEPGVGPHGAVSAAWTAQAVRRGEAGEEGAMLSHKQLSGFFEAALGDAERAQIEALLASDPAARQQLAEQRCLDQALR